MGRKGWHISAFGVSANQSTWLRLDYYLTTKNGKYIEAYDRSQTTTTTKSASSEHFLEFGHKLIWCSMALIKMKILTVIAWKILK